MVNIQAIEGGKDTGSFLCGFNRFFNECSVPKICFPDKDSALLKILSQGEIDLIGKDGVLSRERGINFQTCPAQGHNAHGMIERKIGLIQDCLNRSGIKNQRLHTIGWQTVAKQIERDINNIPLGYLWHTGERGPLLQILRPNLLKLNTNSERAPNGILISTRLVYSVFVLTLFP